MYPVHPTVPTNLEEIRRTVATFRGTTRQSRPVQPGPGVAGHQHAWGCSFCKEPRVSEICKCVEQCSWPECPIEVPRAGDPVVYSEGFTQPPLPRFEETQ